MTIYKKRLPVQTSIEVNRETLSDLLSLINEGGISYWGQLDCDEDTYAAAKERLLAGGVKDDDLCWEDVLAEVLIDGDVLTIYDREDDDRPNDFSLSDLEYAISSAAVEYGTDMDTWDGCTGDYLGQMACFGEIIYG